ncbi:DUF3630 family protein [Shewanella abyssi]|uniref:DUF3630 family protein n=1 Tax=Shewanella abyssi TaxID=311789 RepID=UPI00200E0A2E|nr:DUF3630 family protein [Shewanella abyssi]MCL1049303.1 DUF3630 family protein [Shewanella abyssi]MCL1049318.1 DUF3630 family protein [Shewanella abyssi]
MKLNAIKLERETLSLSVQADIDFELFADFAEAFAQAIDCTVVERQWGADRHQWLLEFEGAHLQLHYEFYGDICWLSTEKEDEFDVLVYLAELMKPYLASQI